MNSKRYSFLIFLGCFLLSNIGLAQAKINFEIWRTQQVQVSVDKIFASMSFADTAKGAVVASPSKSYPDYYYHWVRDAALVMDTLVDFYQHKNSSHSQSYIQNKMNNYISFSKNNQETQTLTGLGEPKFYVDGKSFGLSWGRPQTDGPALRALTLIRWAHVKLDEGATGYVESRLYNAADFNSLIKADLEYVSRNWNLPSYDLWEEVRADHFFTKVVQRAALLEGANLAQRLQDSAASDWYLKQAGALTAQLNSFMDPTLEYIPVSQNYSEGLNAKQSGLDVAVILAVLRSPEKNAFVSVEHLQLQKTLNVLIESFQKIYSINQKASSPGTAIGRYPEDVYDGVGTSRANPWVLSTMAVAEAYYKLAKHYIDQGQMKRAVENFDKGEQFFKRVQLHANADYSLSEQMDRESGYMVGARDLTWSHASVIKADQARKIALKKIIR